MKKIIPFLPLEEETINEVKSYLESVNKLEESKTLSNNEEALHDLARSISKYPSILGVQHLGGARRSVDTLVDTLQFHDMMDLVLYIPTKALLGKSFSFAKINFFYMIYYIAREHPGLGDHEDRILDIISGNIFTVMAEEVFLSIISDKKISKHVRSNAGYLLANIWEYRMGHGVSRFAPVLNKVWEARKAMKPVYGTMLGLSELFMLSQNSSGIWIRYLQREELNQDEIDALREFLMGLTYEEMKMLGENMDRSGKTCLNEQEMDIILGERKIYPEYRYDDPRELFKSYRHRSKNASFRLRALREGPKKTMEEYIMCYLLSLPDAWIAPVAHEGGKESL